MCVADQGMDRRFIEKGAKRVNFLSVKTPLVKEKHRCLLLVILGRRRGVLSGAEVPIDLRDSRSSFLASPLQQTLLIPKSIFSLFPSPTLSSRGHHPLASFFEYVYDYTGWL